jgi:hypothetical protein
MAVGSLWLARNYWHTKHFVISTGADWPAEWSGGHATLSHKSAAMDNFIQITPFLYVADLDMALAFFTDILGFEVQFRGWNEFAYVHRETVGFRLWQRPPEDLPQGARRFAHYIEVRDVDAIYAELKPKLDTLPAGDATGPPTSTMASGSC